MEKQSTIPADPVAAARPLRAVLRRFAETAAEKLSGRRTEPVNRLLLLVFSSVVLTFLVTPRLQLVRTGYHAGDIVTSSIKADQDYLLEDAALTAQKRREAEATAPVVYVFDADAPGEMKQRLVQGLDAVRAGKANRDPEQKKHLRQGVSELLGFDISFADLAALSRIAADRKTPAELARIVDRIHERKIVPDGSLFANDALHGIRAVDPDTGKELPAAEYRNYLDLGEARKLLGRLKVELDAGPQDLEAVRRIVAATLRPTLSFDRELTDQAKKEAREGVSPILFQVKRGEIIAREGERITTEQVHKLGLIANAGTGLNKILATVGIFALVLILCYFPYRFARKNIRKFNPSNRDLLLLVYVTIGCFVILKLGLVIATALGGTFAYIRSADFYYLFPFALGAMLVRIVLNSEVALVYCAVCAVMTGILFENSLPVLVYSLMGGIVGAHGVRQCKDRGAIYLAGAKVSVVNTAVVLAFQVPGDGLFSLQTMICVIFAASSGLISAALATATIPVLEFLFGYTTDIKLLELANLNAPILRELMVKAPGTYHHSVLVGNMVEAAAEAIHANPLLARVAAYYHDIGKISKPLYFIENQCDGENRHDRLSPNMSALILMSHVKEGAELAKEHRLGQPLIDIIRQSHGTAQITFFLQKARNIAEKEQGSVDEHDFRYPGPKPQTREAGLVMLADCVEAASRTLADPTPARIQGMVQKIINNIFIDGQLDECELTLKNLHEIAKSFNRVLAGIHHHRIDYPEPAYKEKTGGKKPCDDNGRESAKTAQGPEDATKKGGCDDLKRLGMSR